MAALRSVDQVVIVSMLPDGARQLGLYSIATVMAAWAFDQANLIANVIYPRLGETLGRTSDPTDVHRLGLRTAELIALAMVPCAGLLLSVGVPILDWLLPKYREGLVAAGGLIAAAAVLGVSMPLRYALLTTGRTLSMLAVTGVAAGLSLCAGIWVLSHGGELYDISWTSATAASICLALMVLLCAGPHRRLWAVSTRVLLVSLYTALGACAIGDPRDATPLHWLGVAVWCIGPSWLLAQRIRWRDLWSKGTEH
jgi:O-antigen/teichoic acid export membrane protein